MGTLNLLSDIKEFLYHCEFAKGKSLNTIKSLKIDLYRFNEYIIKCNDLEKISDIDGFNFREFLIELQNEDIGKRSLNRKISSLKSFFKYLKDVEKIKSNPAQLIVAPSYDRGVPEALSLKEIKDLRKAIELKNYHSLRDRLIVELLYSSGITSQELLGLGEEVFETEKREVIVSSFKKYRTVFFSERTREFLKRYIQAKKEKLGERYKKEILFVNGSGGRLTDRSLRRLIDRYALRAGITKEISPHSFRHTFAVHMLENGMTLNQLQKLLGHTNLDSTKIYIEALERKKRKELAKELSAE
ncbi:MAG: tyrosine-type recombinase/integrase [Cetobacterium sp.]|uniref:tyrosine-type recombinase/integrase n=1 Tax=unclassified Cetobacterium TaxID=2630983 RepID=UPI00068F742F|nr:MULTISPECIES: tyrosine-type recombinase/integrase [unclassified Cetobacterium]